MQSFQTILQIGLDARTGEGSLVNHEPDLTQTAFQPNPTQPKGAQ